LILIYQALITGQPYQDKRVPVLDQRQKQRMIRHHIRRLGKLSVAVYSLRPSSSATAASPCGPQKRNSSLSGLIDQAIFMV